METSSLPIVIAGAGNVATHLGAALRKSNYTIRGIYSPSGASAQELAGKLGCKAYVNISELPAAGLYILAVKDDAIEEVAAQLPAHDAVVIHTAGSIDMNALSRFNNRGVLYPVQTLSKQKEVDFSNVPLCIEASNPATEELLTKVAKSLSGTVSYVDSRKRLALHISAVFASNFTFFINTVAADILEKESLPFDLLKPLLNETVEKLSSAEAAGLKELQTGPARRGDSKTLVKHLNYLSLKYPEYHELYQLLSNAIARRY